jgi:hypothetical protein
MLSGTLCLVMNNADKYYILTVLIFIFELITLAIVCLIDY